MTDDKLKPCRVCGADCRVEIIGPTENISPEVRLWICSKAEFFGGKCTDRTAYLFEDAWNRRATDPQVSSLVSAAEMLLAQMSDTYKARNGKRMGIEADDGEKCYIVHSDDIFSLRTALDGIESKSGA